MEAEARLSISVPKTLRASCHLFIFLCLCGCEDFGSKHFAFSSRLFVTRPACEGLYSHNLSVKKHICDAPVGVTEYDTLSATWSATQWFTLFFPFYCFWFFTQRSLLLSFWEAAIRVCAWGGGGVGTDGPNDDG